MSTYIRAGGYATTAMIFMTGSAAFADVTSRQVWDDWSGYIRGFGYEMQATENATSGGLEVRDIVMAFQIPEENMTITLKVPEMTFSDNSDGTVSLTLPPVLPLSIRAEGPDTEDGEAVLEYLTDDFKLTFSGDASDMTYVYSAASLGLTLASLMVEGEPVKFDAARLDIADFSGTGQMKTGNISTAVQDMKSGPVTYEVDFKDPSGNGNYLLMKGGNESLAMTGTSSFPENMNIEDIAAALHGGFSFEGSYILGAGNMALDFQEEGATSKVNSTTGGSTLSVAMDENRLLYGGESQNVQMDFTSSDLPFPVSAAMDKAGFQLKMPISKTESAQDFALSLTLGNFTMSDMIWGMFDPEAKLPRDPATVAVDLSGMARLAFDLLDPAQMEAVESGEQNPGELESVALNSLTVSAAGAKLTGDGAFTFDNSDTTTYDGMPKPIGTINLALTGGNGLLDALVAMGLLPEDQAMGVRMMMGMFAVPGEGEDALKSQLEFNEAGQILANGQRLK